MYPLAGVRRAARFSLASRMREHSLFEISRKLSGAVNFDDVALADFFGSHQ
jgi:hypothetical protein